MCSSVWHGWVCKDACFQTGLLQCKLTCAYIHIYTCILIAINIICCPSQLANKQCVLLLGMDGFARTHVFRQGWCSVNLRARSYIYNMLPFSPWKKGKQCVLLFGMDGFARTHVFRQGYCSVNLRVRIYNSQAAESSLRKQQTNIEPLPSGGILRYP